MSYWYYKSNGEEIGPVTATEICANLAKGIAADLYKGPGMKSWVPASRAEEALRIEALRRMPPVAPDNDEVHCINCGSTQVHAEKRGYSFLWGGIFGSSQIIITCLMCGQKFRPGGKPY